jgi:peptidoglycan/LPS O-acetylase OafA/YrhL
MLSGGEAVQLFFVISGFYMALILSKKYHSASLFYSNRFLRLYPTYALVLLGTMIWFLIEWAYTHQRPPPFWIAEANAQMPIWQWLALQFSNLTMLGLDVPSWFHWKSGQGFLFLHGGAETAPDGAEWGARFLWIEQAWSVGTEIWFYLLAPFLVRRSVAIQIALASASCVLMVLMMRVSPLTYFFFPANLWFFLVGSLLFRLSRSRYFSPPEWSGSLALAYVLAAGCSVDAVSNPIVHTIMLAFIALSIPLLFHTFANRQWDNVTGNLSYPVYLIHLLVIGILVATFRIHSGPLAAIASVSAAMLIVRFIENPMDKYRQRRVSREG